MRIFVYGTLKPGGANYGLCAGKIVAVQPALAHGQLFALPVGYPAMTPGTGKVQGYLLTFRDGAILQALDQLEDYNPSREPDQNEYERHWIEVLDPQLQPLGQAWAYRMTLERVRCLGGRHLPSGCWNHH